LTPKGIIVTELQTIQDNGKDESISLLALISRASSDPSIDIEKMERIIAMKREMDGKRAEQAFNNAMNAAQSEVRAIGWDKQNRQTSSSYVTYGKMNSALRPIYIRHGFSLSFDTGEPINPLEVRFLCYVSHADGHTRTYKVDMPCDGKGAKGNDVMTRTHAYGSATSYGRRYLLKMIFDVVEADEDDDGNSASVDTFDGREESEEEKNARYINDHQAAVGRNWRTVQTIKDHLLADEPDGYAIAEAWFELSQDEQRKLWLAPSKGGCFTTTERKWLKEEMPKFKDSHSESSKEG